MARTNAGRFGRVGFATLAVAVLVLAGWWLGSLWSGSSWLERLGWQTDTRDTPHEIVLGDGVTGPADMVWVPGGEFLMGSDSRLAQPNEKPAHPVRVGGFWMDVTHVTNQDFARFVEETGYVTTAQRKPDWETIRVQLPPGTPRPPEEVLVSGAMVFTGTSAPANLMHYWQWWTYVPIWIAVILVIFDSLRVLLKQSRRLN